MFVLAYVVPEAFLGFNAHIFTMKHMLHRSLERELALNVRTLLFIGSAANVSDEGLRKDEELK